MKRKKLLLALLIVNFIVMMGSAVFMHIVAIISDGSSSINLTPLFIIVAGALFILAIIEGLLGIFVYEEKRWAAIGMILCEFITWIGIFGLVAALMVFQKPNEYENQP